ncbi:MAG TPA: hypothetical protein VF777_05945 [Phycisphaerales bacterium]
MKTQGRGFTMVDLVVAIGVAGVLSAVGVPAVRTATSDNALQRCRYNLRGLAQGSAMYTEDFGGRMWALSWRQGMEHPDGPLGGFEDDMQAQSYQATHALRRVLNVTQQQLPVPSRWTPTINYSHTVLLDYLGARQPLTAFTCPSDGPRAQWLRGDYSNIPPNPGDGAGPTIGRWLGSTSYTYSPYQWMPDRQVSYPYFSGTRLSPTAFPNASDISYWEIWPYPVATGWWGPRPASDVRFPSQKVAMFDEIARHNGAQLYYGYLSASQDLAFYDGSIRWYRTDATNPGWNSDSQQSRSNMLRRFSHRKVADYLGGLPGGVTSATFPAGWFRWTRGGLLGWDVPRLSSMVGKPPSASVVENELDTRSGQW